MSSSNSVAECPACNYANPLDSRFCQKCGKAFVYSCRSCRAENSLNAEFCISCGVKLSEAAFGITKERAEAWGSHFTNSFPELASMWSPKGFGTKKVVPLATQITLASDPPPFPEGEPTALLLPIANRDWCIRTARFNATTITSGALWASMTTFAVFDFTQRRAYSVRYELLASANQEGDEIRLSTSDGSTIHFVIRVPRPSKGSPVRGFLLDVVGILGSRDQAGRELTLQRSERESEEYRRNLQKADDFVASILNFFSEIIDQKRKLDSARG